MLNNLPENVLPVTSPIPSLRLAHCNGCVYVTLPTAHRAANQSTYTKSVFIDRKVFMKASFLFKVFGTAVLCASAALPALATSVSISVHQPGVYGRVTVGEPVPQTAWMAPQPVVVVPSPVVVERAPIYLYVPTAHTNNWPRHCGRYNACSQPVIFVRDSWVRERHAAHYRDRDGDGIRNRFDRDRDGDGRRNGRDKRPNNPNVR